MSHVSQVLAGKGEGKRQEWPLKKQLSLLLMDENRYEFARSPCPERKQRKVDEVPKHPSKELKPHPAWNEASVGLSTDDGSPTSLCHSGTVCHTNQRAISRRPCQPCNQRISRNCDVCWTSHLRCENLSVRQHCRHIHLALIRK